MYDARRGAPVFSNREFASCAAGCIAARIMQRNRKMTPHDTARSLVLVGMMGVGKTTVGRRLALRLGRPFVDADEAIELAAGMTIQEMFDRYGEAAFRDGERRVIARLIEGSPKVIATGGGAFVHPETRALILERATAIWLDADLDVLVERVSRKEGRPLLKGRDPRTVLSELATTRNPYYAMAPVHVVSTSTPHEATVDSILEALESCG
jgi:shikimate kinase